MRNLKLTYALFIFLGLAICAFPKQSLAQEAEQQATSIYGEFLTKKGDAGSKQLEGQYEKQLKAFQDKLAQCVEEIEPLFDNFKSLARKELKDGDQWDFTWKRFLGWFVGYNTEAALLGTAIANGGPALQKAHEAYFQKAQECVNLEKAIETLEKNKGGELWEWTNPNDPTVKILFLKKGDRLISVGGTGNNCIPLPAKLLEVKTCTFCPLFEMLLNAVQTMSTKAYNHIAPGLSNVILIAMAIFIAFKVFNLVSSFTKQEAPKMITELLTQAGKVLFIWLLLHNSSFVYTYFIGPVLSAGLDFGTSILYRSGFECEGKTGDFVIGVFPVYLFNRINCFVMTIQQELAVSQSIGSTLMCVSRNAAATKIASIIGLWDFSMMILGLVIFLFSLLISLAFAFYLIDATARLGIVGALMPFLVASWTFELTREYTQKGWTMFMNSFFTYIFMGAVVSINIELMGQSLSGGKGGFEAITDAINGDKVNVLVEILDIGFGGFLILMACCIFGFQMTAKVTQLADNMAGGGGGENIGSKIGGMAASAATGVAKIAGKAAIGAATGGAGAAIGGKAGAAISDIGRGSGKSTSARIGSMVGARAGSAVNKTGKYLGKKTATAAKGAAKNIGDKIKKIRGSKERE